MQRVVLLAIGRIKENWARDACAFYQERLSRALRFDIVELPASRETDPLRQREDESRRLLKFIEEYDADIWVLDENGKGLTSPAFAAEMEKAKDSGRTVAFLLGGAYGFNDTVRAKGRLLKLSDMVFPHELCRVVFLEQLYRATEIAKGSGYHH
jgi:23S rRNA (pseudouridine1915-N3)-methyltransferase